MDGGGGMTYVAGGLVMLGEYGMDSVLFLFHIAGLKKKCE
jgi:hypothetical protein